MNLVSVPTYGVRRMTPRECERLQGYPDGWTDRGASGKLMADGARYRMLGNSVAVPCIEWLARRFATVITTRQEPQRRTA